MQNAKVAMISTNTALKIFEGRPVQQAPCVQTHPLVGIRLRFNSLYSACMSAPCVWIRLLHVRLQSISWMQQICKSETQLTVLDASLGIQERATVMQAITGGDLRESIEGIHGAVYLALLSACDCLRSHYVCLF